MAQTGGPTQCVPDIPCFATGYGPTYGTDGSDLIYGDHENNSIAARAGADEVHAGPNWGGTEDVVLGEDGPDDLYGERGTDYLQGDKGADRLFGGPGHESEPGCRKDCLGVISGGGGRDRLFGGGGQDNMHGRWGSDRLNGGAGSDGLAGWEGADRLTGSEGVDQLRGGPGDDFIDAAHADPAGTADGKVNCGQGSDRAVVNREDPVARNCERVRVVA